MRNGMIAAAALSLAGGVASASVYQWNWNAGDSATDSRGGAIESIVSTFDTSSDMLTWDVTFSNQFARGYTLAISDGPNPKGETGELALLYFDATDMINPVISVYGYNAQNDQTSYKDGKKGSAVGAPDRIATSLDNAFASTFQSISATDNAGKRTFSFAMDASVINNHSPLYPTANVTWAGMQYDELIGVWFHPTASLATSYDANGYLSDWQAVSGWLDGSNFQTELVPAPGTAALLGLGGLTATRRRRK